MPTQDKKAGKKEVLNKVDTLRTLLAQGLTDTKQTLDAINKLRETGEIRVLPASFFEGAPEVLVAFAKEFHLMKEAGEKGSGAPRKKGTTSLGQLVRSAVPEVDEALKHVDALAGKSWIVEVDGEKVEIAYQPFWRRIVSAEVKEGETTTI